MTYQIRAGKAFPGEPGCRWLINGDKGAIQLTSPRGCFDIDHVGIEIKYWREGEEEAETVTLREDELSGLEQPAQNVGRLYDAYAKGKTESYADWKGALKRHKFIDELFTFMDEAILLYIEWGGHNLLWYFGVFSAVLAASSEMSQTTAWALSPASLIPATACSSGSFANCGS